MLRTGSSGEHGGGAGPVVGLDDAKGLFQHLRFCVSVNRELLLVSCIRCWILLRANKRFNNKSNVLHFLSFAWSVAENRQVTLELTLLTYFLLF